MNYMDKLHVIAVTEISNIILDRLDGYRNPDKEYVLTIYLETINNYHSNYIIHRMRDFFIQSLLLDVSNYIIKNCPDLIQLCKCCNELKDDYYKTS